MNTSYSERIKLIKHDLVLQLPYFVTNTVLLNFYSSKNPEY